jgi:hypothetical protein
MMIQDDAKVVLRATNCLRRICYYLYGRDFNTFKLHPADSILPEHPEEPPHISDLWSSTSKFTSYDRHTVGAKLKLELRLLT